LSGCGAGTSVAPPAPIPGKIAHPAQCLITFGDYDTKAAQQQAQRDQNMMLMMPYMNPRPTTTDCYRYGNAVRCTTR